MSHLGRIAVAACGLAAAVASQPSQSPPSKYEALKAWACRVFRFDPKVYQRMVGVREGHEQMSGSRIMMADLRTQTVSRVAECPDGCWSPAVVANRIVYAQADGVSEVQNGATPHQIVAANGIEMVIGPLENGSSLLVLVAGPAQNPCRHTLGIADLATGKLAGAPEGAPKCLEDTDIGALPRPGTLRGNRILRTTPPGGGARRLLVEELPPGDAPRGGQRRSLLPWMDEKDDGVDRFDAVWVDESRVVFLEK